MYKRRVKKTLKFNKTYPKEWIRAVSDSYCYKFFKPRNFQKFSHQIWKTWREKNLGASLQVIVFWKCFKTLAKRFGVFLTVYSGLKTGQFWGLMVFGWGNPAQYLSNGLRGSTKGRPDLRRVLKPVPCKQYFKHKMYFSNMLLKCHQWLASNTWINQQNRYRIDVWKGFFVTWTLPLCLSSSLSWDL